ncbi:MAG TPA: hypothetical protein VKT33_12440 [Candidatus Angelobacter sp.]|nr:hypothetical protein [Candidatus Angelobacter sp.]
MTPDDTMKSKGSFAEFGRKLDQGLSQAAEKLDQESEKVIAYLNDEVVPSIRTHSTKAMRIAAEKLTRLAEYIDKEHSR